MRRDRTTLLAAAGLVAAVALASRTGLARPQGQSQADRTAASAVKGERFEFEVVQSADAHYLGDTPSHVGRGGGLGQKAPDIALDDPVYHGTQKVGRVTSLTWDRSKASLEIEVDPEPKVRIPVGWTVWVKLGGEPAGGGGK
jgi:hypothetical protein